MLKLMPNWLKRRTKEALPAVNNNVDDTVAEASVPSDRFDRNDIGTAEMVPYDEHLFERSRTQWQFGDWESLIKLQPDLIKHHPDRAKLALLAAASQQQRGNTNATRQFTQLANDWGCSKKLISQILIAGVYNTLGRASAIDNSYPRAIQHFRNAISIASPGGDSRLLAEARARQELHNIEELGLKSEDAWLTDDQKNYPQAFINTFYEQPDQPVSESPDPQKSQERTADQANHEAEIKSIVADFQINLKKEASNIIKQLEAYMKIQTFMQGGRAIPTMHGWPISADLAVYLTKIVKTEAYDLVIEFGSGASTAIIAQALFKTEKTIHSTSQPNQIAFEHLDEYRRKTVSLLDDANVDCSRLDLVLSPLKLYSDEVGEFSFYDTVAALSKYGVDSDDRMRSIKIFVFVDGPPESTNRLARYPTLPVVLKYFPTNEIHLLLDDTDRADERETVKLWCEILKISGRTFTTSYIPLEKGAMLIKIKKECQNG